MSEGRVRVRALESRALLQAATEARLRHETLPTGKVEPRFGSCRMIESSHGPTGMEEQ